MRLGGQAWCSYLLCRQVQARYLGGRNWKEISESLDHSYCNRTRVPARLACCKLTRCRSYLWETSPSSPRASPSSVSSFGARGARLTANPQEGLHGLLQGDGPCPSRSAGSSHTARSGLGCRPPRPPAWVWLGRNRGWSQGNWHPRQPHHFQHRGK